MNPLSAPKSILSGVKALVLQPRFGTSEIVPFKALFMQPNKKGTDARSSCAAVEESLDRLEANR